MSQMVMTEEFVNWLGQFDSLPDRKDSKADLIWKAAQRDIYERAKAIHKRQVEGSLGKSNVAKKKGFKLRPEE